jgi:hypothetical protein
LGIWPAFLVLAAAAPWGVRGLEWVYKRQVQRRTQWLLARLPLPDDERGKSAANDKAAASPKGSAANDTAAASPKGSAANDTAAASPIGRNE